MRCTTSTGGAALTRYRLYIRRGTTCFARGIGRSCTRRGDAAGGCFGDGRGSFSTDERGDADGDAEGDASESEVGADVSDALSSYSSSELEPVSSAAPSFLPFRRPRRGPFGVSSESSESDIPTTARVDDHVLFRSSFATGAAGWRSGSSASVVEICGIGRPPNVPDGGGDIALSFRGGLDGVVEAAVVTVVGADEIDAVSPALPEPSVIAVETIDVDAGETRPLLSSGDDDVPLSAWFRPGGVAGLVGDLPALRSERPADDSVSSPSSGSLSLSESSSGAPAAPSSRARGLYVPFAIFQHRWHPTMFSPSRISTAVNIRRHSSTPGRCPSFAHSACVASAAPFATAPAPPEPADMTCCRSRSGLPVTGCTSASTRRRYAMSWSESFWATGGFVSVSFR